ncbi:MAG: PAS domain S-box protein [Candidatus Binatia bacterium]
MEDISGYRLEEVQGKDWFATFLPEGERSRIQAVFSRAVRGVRIHANINPVVTKDGTERLIEWHAKTLKDAEGTVVGVLSVGHDITERKRAEQRLFTQHAVTQILARSASLQDAIPQLLQAICEGVGWELGELWRLDREAKLLRWDGGWHVPALNGSTFQAVSRETPFAFAEGLPGRVWASGTPVWVTDVATDAAFLRGTIAARLGLHGAFAFPVRKGDDLIGVMAFFGRIAGPPDHELLRMFDALGRQIGDFIERKRVEEEMMRLVAIVESSDDAIIGRTVDGSIVSWNRGAEKTYGYSAAEAIGRPVSMLLPPDRPHEMNQILERIRSGQRITHYETVRLRKDGTRVPVALTVSPMNDGEGRLIGTSSIARDITERKRAEAERHELQKLAQQRERLADIGAITAQIVHDVGNPLAGISMQAQLVLRRAQRDGRQPLSAVVRPLERVLAEVSRLDALVKEFTEFSHEQRLDVKTIDLRRFLYGVVELWQPVAAARQITLTVEGRPADLAVRADGEKLRRVLDNLVKNAIEAIDRGPGSVKIAVSQVSPDAVRITVADSGPGIPDTVQVFRLFETTKTNGSGIGLAVARQIVLAHRGKIECARLDPHGTVFRIELPCAGPVG